uniref:Securin n=1 Tax=Molossus molossus TaxID=27622 RepID=A0A7J8IC82_MOLMO|nr:PTTG1 regulator of sister chromatid separation, securin [Molossus molossus]
MATVIFVDKENGQPGTRASSKDRLKLGSRPYFESFDLPEEHQIAQLPLNGVPLMILDEERKLEKLLHLGPPSPLKMPSPLWESDPLQSPSSSLSALDVELPPVCCD